MALLTIPSVVKGTAVSVTLNKTELFALSAVAADAFFSNSTNVKRCVIEYNSDPGNQREILDFDLSQASPTASMLISINARDSFLLERLVLEDYDGGVLVVERANLPSGLDVTFAGGGGGSNSITWTSDISASSYLATPTSVKKLSATGWDFNVVSNETKSGVISVEMTLSSELATLSDRRGFFGLQEGPANSSGGFSMVDYSFYVSGTTVYHIKKGEDWNYIPGFAKVAGDVLTIETGFENGSGVVRWKRNGVVVRTLTNQVFAANYRVGMTMYDQNTEFSNISFTSS